MTTWSKIVATPRRLVSAHPTVPLAIFFAIFGLPTAALSQSPGDRAVVTVAGEPMTVAELEKRLAQMPPFQLKSMGGNPDEIKRNFVDGLVNLELQVHGAREAKLDELPEVSERMRGVLTSAITGRLRKKIAKDVSVTDAEVREFYDAHQEHYKPQKRIKISQIAVKSQGEAKKLLAHIKTDPEYQKDPTAGWEKLVREHSIDGTTKMRGGDLGHVHPDGSTAHRDVRVEVVMYAAADKIKDGEVYPEPIQVEDSWVVLQRRGSYTTPHRTLGDETPNIRKRLVKLAENARINEIMDKLRTEHVTAKNPSLVDQIEISETAEISISRRAGVLRSHPAAGAPRPQGRPGRMR